MAYLTFKPLMLSYLLGLGLVLLPLLGKAEQVDQACQDTFAYGLAVQLGDDGYWLSFKDKSPLPINHMGGDQILTLSVQRLDPFFVLINVAVKTKTNFWTWKAQIEMSQSSPVKFLKTFKPEPDMPMFALSLDPVCTGI